MAEIILEHEGKEKKIEVKDGESLKELKKHGVTFGCEEGICGTCLLEVEEGIGNLSKPTEEENDMGMEGNERLACQCKIKKGTAKVKQMI